MLPLPLCTIVCRSCTLYAQRFESACLCCSQWWVLVWKDERFLTNGRGPTTWQWWMVLQPLGVVLGLSRLWLEEWRAEVTLAVLKHVLSPWTLSIPQGFFPPQPSVTGRANVATSQVLFTWPSRSRTARPHHLKPISLSPGLRACYDGRCDWSRCYDTT